jgi:hypothetical protein
MARRLCGHSTDYGASEVLAVENGVVEARWWYL